VTAAAATAPAGASVDSPVDDGVLATLRGASAPVRALLVGVLLNRLGRFLQVYLVLFLTARGFSAPEAGLALGAYGAGTVAGVLVGGVLADRLGARLCTLVSMVGAAALIPAIQYLHDIRAVVAVVLAVGVVTQLFRPAASALLGELTPRHQRVMIFSIYQMAFSIGNALAPLIGAVLVAISYDVLFWTEALACLAFAGVAAVALPRRGAVAGGDGAAPAGAGTSRRRGGYAAVLADRRYLLFLAAAFVNLAVYLQSVAILPLAMRDAGLPTTWYGAMFLLNGLVVLVLQLPVTRVVQRRPAAGVVTLGFALLAAGHAVYWLPAGSLPVAVPIVVIFVLGTLVWSVAEIVGGPTVAAWPSLTASAGLQGRYQGAFQAAFGLGSAVGPLVGVVLWDRLGPTTWLVSAGAALVALVAARAAMCTPTSRPTSTSQPTVTSQLEEQSS
jgi:predicted MFS family arabinose efflux permease